MDLEINGNRLVVKELGPKDAPAMIAHHGAPGIGDHRDSEAEFGPYSDAFRVIVFDARGSGGSEGNPPLTHEQWEADVDALAHMKSAVGRGQSAGSRPRRSCGRRTADCELILRLFPSSHPRSLA
jgi:pimeloyl-ACP methyl ester carboxylesterase